MEEEERRKIENWRFMGRTKAYIHVPSSSAYSKVTLMTFCHIYPSLEKILIE